MIKIKDISIFKELFSENNNEFKKIKNDVDVERLDSKFLKFESKIPFLEEISYLMEEVVLKHGENADMYVGFQKLSRAEAVWDRYLKIANKAQKLYVFGQKDRLLTEHPKLKFIFLPEGHSLIREWFVIINLPNVKSILSAYDLDGFGKFEDEKERQFKGVKSNNPFHVQKAIGLLKKII